MTEQKYIRNFCIIAHIDHGKSTLADRFLELTNAIPKEKMRPCYLDMMDLEREKGITIKMQPVRMSYDLNLKLAPYRTEGSGAGSCILNLIDTPGHVDFSYEVSRALAAVEGAILLIDATKGIQAQTLSNLDLAKKQKLKIIPVVNKIDSPQARTEETKQEIANLLNISFNEVFTISAKNGTNVKELLGEVIIKVPPPGGDALRPLRALIFDSKYDVHKGVIAFVRIVDGQVKKGEKIYLLAVKAEGDIKEVGYFRPELSPCEILSAGEIGYIATGIKEPGKVRVGDTITKLKIKNEKLAPYHLSEAKIGAGLKINDNAVEPLPGYKEPKSMVFASIYPENADDFELLREGLLKLKLNDASLVFEPEAQGILGRGFRCGFLGMLHVEIISERLRREFNLNLVISSPSVLYKILTKNPAPSRHFSERSGRYGVSNEIIFVRSANDFPDPSKIERAEEPWVKLEVMILPNYLGQVLELLEKLEGKYIETKYFSQTSLLLIYEAPLRNIISNFYDQLKNVTQGYGSMNYEILDYRTTDLVKIDILIVGEKEEVFSRIVPQQKAFEEGKRMVEKLKEILPSQQFAVAIQAAIGGKIIARETKKATRKDVTGYLYGGDYTRKRKLLEKQKKGKKELKEKGQMKIPPKVFLEMMKR